MSKVKEEVNYDDIFDMDIGIDDEENISEKDVFGVTEQNAYVPSQYLIHRNKAKHMELGLILALYYEAVYTEDVLPNNLLEDNTQLQFHVPDIHDKK